MVVFCMVSIGSLSSQNKPVFIKKDHSGQLWYKEILKERPSYPLVEKLFNSYFEEHPFEKSLQKNQVRRWLMTNASMQDENGFVQPIVVTKEDEMNLKRAEEKWIENHKNNQQRPVAGAATTNFPPYPHWNDTVGTWRMIGPYHVSDRSNAYNMYGGFNDRVFINYLNPQNMISGQSYGGLWTSQDAGATWKLTDGRYKNGTNTYANRDMYYGDIEVHPANPNRILAATHTGVLMSNNAGETWTLLDSMNQADKPGERTYFIAQKPDDQNVILASYGKRIFRTINGGVTWTMVFDNNAVTHVFNRNQHSDATVYQRRYNFAGLDFHPTNPNIVYLGALNSSNQVCLYKSVNAGQTFSLLVNTTKSKFLKMMVTPADPSHVYFATLFTRVDTALLDDGIYKYDVNGALISFKNIPNTGTSGLVDDVQVSPTNANVWYMGGYASSAVWKSTNGGTSWNFYNCSYCGGNGTDYVHPDIRSLAISGDTVLVGTDGGLHITRDGGLTFYPSGKWISAIDQWGFSSAYKGDVAASGDDHGPTEIRHADADRGWVPIGGADSGEIQVNACNTNYAYGRDVYTRFMAVKINDTTYSRNSNTLIDAKYLYLSQDPDSYFSFYPVKDKVLMRSTDNMFSATNLFTFANNITKVETALKNNQLVFVLENRNRIRKSTNGGISFVNITPSTGVTGGQTLITDFEINETGNIIWLVYGNSQTVCKVVRSTDGGTTWVNVTNGNFPSLPMEHVTYQRGTNGMVYVSLAREGGVWYRDLSMPNWLKLGAGLPMLGYVTSIYTVPDKGRFRMGTSRGAFEHPLPVNSSVGAHFSVNSRTSNACILDTSYFFDYSSYFGTNATFQWTFEGGTPATSTAMNPKVVYLEPGTFDVTLVVTDGNNNSSTYTRNDFMLVTREKPCGPQVLPTYAQFSNNQSQYTLTPSMGLVNTRNYTFMAWVKGEGTQVDYAGIFSHELSSNGRAVLNCRDVNADSTQIGYHYPDGQWWWNSGHYLKPNQWTHLAMVVEANGITIYKNGEGRKHSFTVPVRSLITNGAIGSFLGATWYRNFKGFVDEAAFYNRSLTATEIRNMMHLTKQNPKYIDQQDAGLIAYYQYNENIGSTVKDVSGNNRDASINGSLQILESDGPFGGGRSQTLNVTSSATIFNFSDPGVKIKFQGTVPNGNVVVNHIENLPDVFPTTKKNHEIGYYIINNYGTNKFFSPLENIEFTKTGTVSTELANTNSGFELFDRSTYMHDINFVSRIDNNFSSIAGNIGAVKANNASRITSFGQYFLVRNSYPQGSPKVRIVPPALQNQTVEGGESVSLWISSANQGFILPRLIAGELQAAGAPVEGMLAYHKDLKKIILFADNKWNTIKSGPILNIPNSTVIPPSASVIVGSNPASDLSGILNVKELGFIKFRSTNNNDLVNIKYPTESQLLFNSDIKNLQFFNGSNWTNFILSPSTISVSTSSPTTITGLSVGTGNKLPNAAIQDNDVTGAILIPRIRPEDVKDPAEGLMIYDSNRGYFFFYDGGYWNRIEK
jgi:photosystem II stability/assembly factor-like uncharacterized protein